MTDARVYTFVFEYKGGTYIDQVSAANPRKALTKWAMNLPEEDLQSWKLKRAELLSLFEAGSPVPLTGLLNVWCISGISMEDEQLLLNIVATEEGPRG